VRACVLFVGFEILVMPLPVELWLLICWVTWLSCIVQLLEKFIEEYYDQNPISQLGLITLCNKRAERVSELSG